LFQLVVGLLRHHDAHEQRASPVGGCLLLMQSLHGIGPCEREKFAFLRNFVAIFIGAGRAPAAVCEESNKITQKSSFSPLHRA
jgi:hypothetical protein